MDTVSNVPGDVKWSHWSPEAIRIRQTARARLRAAVLLLADREHERARRATLLLQGELPEPAAHVADTGEALFFGHDGGIATSEQLLSQAADVVAHAVDRQSNLRLRAGQIARCGDVRVAYACGHPVLSGAGLVVARVSKCGQRLCPECAREASRKNAARLGKRLDKLENEAQAARRGVLVARMVARHERAKDAARLFAVRAPHDVGILAEAARLQRNADIDDIETRFGGKACVERDSQSRTWWSFVLAATKKATKKAGRRLVRAVAQQQAQRDLAAAEKKAGVSRAMRAAFAAHSDDRAVYLAAVLPGAAIDPLWLTVRDGLRLPGLLRRAAEGCGRARAALATLRRQEQARREHAFRLGVAAHQFRVELAEATAAEMRRNARTAAARSHLFRAADIRLITLTQRLRENEPLAAAIDRLRGAQKRLAKSAAWRNHVAAAAWKMEVEWSTPDTRGDKAREHRKRAAAATTEAQRKRWLESAERLDARASWASSGCGWHCHLHVLASCGFWEQSELASAWRQASIDAGGDGQVQADIRINGDSRGKKKGRSTLAEIVKYVSKPITKRDLPIERLAELVDSMAGRRWLWTTGGFRGVELVDHDEDAGETTINVDHTLGVIGVAGERILTSWDDVEWRDDDDAVAEFIARQRQHEHRSRRALSIDADASSRGEAH